MTPKLIEQLHERLSQQTAVIESMAASELQRLGASLKAESNAALASMRSATAESVASTTASLTRDMARLRRLGRWLRGMAVLGGAMIAGLAGLSLWLWLGPPTTTERLLSEVGVAPVFTTDGRTYLLLPQGSEALRCTQGRSPSVPCVALPMQVPSTAPSLERTLQEQEQAATTEAGAEQASGAPVSGGAAQGEGGRLLWPPAVRPQARPGEEG